MTTKRATNYTVADTYVHGQAVRLERIMVNTGEASATVEVQVEGATIATIAADNPDIGRVFDLELPERGFTIVIVGTPDVTSFYD